jgi:hypothetical protein
VLHFFASNFPKRFSISTTFQIVSAGIQTLFDIISETKHQHPAICSKALSSLFDIFQGELKNLSMKSVSEVFCFEKEGQ